MENSGKKVVAWLLGGAGVFLVLMSVTYANVSLFVFPSVEGYCWPESPSVIMRGHPYGWPFTGMITKPYVSRWGTLWLEEPPLAVYPGKVIANVIIASGMTAATFFVTARWLRDRSPRVSIKVLLATIGVCATYLGLAQGHMFFMQRLVGAICFICIFAGIMATYIAAIDLTGMLFRNFVRRRDDVQE